MSELYYIIAKSVNYSTIQTIYTFTSRKGRDKYLNYSSGDLLTTTHIINAVPQNWDPDWIHEMAEFRGGWFTAEDLKKVEIEEGCEIRVTDDIARMNEHDTNANEPKKLNVQKFRDRIASYYRLMNVDKSSCVGKKERELFARRVRKNFRESMDIICPGAKEYDRARYDKILERMETFLIDKFDDFDRIGLCA